MNIVFSHHGTVLPKYLYLNLQRTAKIFPEHKVWLITDSVSTSSCPKGINILRSKPNFRTEEIEKLLEHPKDFRANFWLHAITRFDSLNQALLELKSPLIHFESDIIMSRDFPFESFSNINKGIAFPVVSRERGVASTIYFADQSTAELLVELSLSSVRNNPKTSDMLILREFYDKHPDLTTILPIAPFHCPDYKMEMEPNLRTKIDTGAQLFGGIIDGHDLGVYFFGTDPRNARGRMILNREVDLNLIHTSRWKLKYDSKRQFVNLLDSNGVETKVFSIHLTAKDPKGFKENTLTKYFNSTISNTKEKEHQRLILIVFLKQAIAALKRRIFN